MSNSWINACHEAGHATLAAIHNARPDGMRIYNNVCDAGYTLPAGVEPEKGLLIHCLVALSGTIAESKFGGATARRVGEYTDGKQFSRDLQGAYFLSEWAPVDAETVLRPLVTDLLEKNDRLFYQLANLVHRRQHVYADDARARVVQYKQQFGINGGPLMQPDWRRAFRQALEDEVARMEMAARVQRRGQTPASAQTKAMPRPTIERKVGTGSGTLLVK